MQSKKKKRQQERIALYNLEVRRPSSKPTVENTDRVDQNKCLSVKHHRQIYKIGKIPGKKARKFLLINWKKPTNLIGKQT